MLELVNWALVKSCNALSWICKSWNPFLFLQLTAESDAGRQSPLLEQKAQPKHLSFGPSKICWGQAKPSLDLVFFWRPLLLLVVARDVLGDEDVDDFQSEHRAELLLGHARLNELALRHCSVVVLVHLVERCKWTKLFCGSWILKIENVNKSTLGDLSWQGPPGWPYQHLSRWSTKKDPSLSSEAPAAKT